jgi:hypothetical protein
VTNHRIESAQDFEWNGQIFSILSSRLSSRLQQIITKAKPKTWLEWATCQSGTSLDRQGVRGLNWLSLSYRPYIVRVLFSG